MGFFKFKKKMNFNKVDSKTILEESDFSVLTSKGEFIQFDYVENDYVVKPIELKPGIWSIIADMSGFHLEKSEYSNDKILDQFLHVKDLEDKVTCFFNKLDQYRKFGIEVPKRAALLYGPPGCHAKGSEILMYDGTIKKVEDVVVGDLLMGPDSTPRKVLELRRGRDEMLKITPIKGESFIVNKNHIFHLTPSGKNETFRCPINISGKDLIHNITKCARERFKLTRTGVEFVKKDQKIDPYILGLWLGDGTSETVQLTTADQEIEKVWVEYGQKFQLTPTFRKEKNNCKTISLTFGNVKGYKIKGKNKLLTIFQEYNLINNKHIPLNYLTGDREQRLKLLAGLIDSDGTVDVSGVNKKILKAKNYSYTTKLEHLANQVVFLCRSLGYAAYKKPTLKAAYINGVKGKESLYYRVHISGSLEHVPVLLERKKCFKREQIKDVLRTGFQIEELPIDDYYGFTLDKDHLYLTSDFTIHHNSGKTTSLNKVVKNYENDGKTAILIWSTDKVSASDVKTFFKRVEYRNVERLILIAEDIGGVEIDQVRLKSEPSLLSLLDNKERSFKIPTFIIATTNHPEVFLGNLVNRPDRFDDKIEMGFPSPEMRLQIYEFFSKEEASEEEKQLLKSKRCDEFTPAHLREILLRSAIYDKPRVQVINDILKEIEYYKSNFQKVSKVGFNDW